jgi:mannose-6-phosphate isomerase-like protein (cupin superfamily)
VDTIRAGAGYTAVNLKEVEDKAAASEHAPNVEARFAREPLALERSGCSYLRLAPGFRMPFGHRHDVQEEVYVVVTGSACARIGDDVLELKAFDAVRVAPDAIRALESGPNGAELVVFGAPLGERSDATPVPDWWVQ